jgi:hypothetical protein
VLLTLVVLDPPPTRADPGRAADRHSPNAEPLVRAGEALRNANPNVFPRVFNEIHIVFGKTLPDVDPLGYQPEHAIYEVLQDVGVVTEPDGWSSRSEQDSSADFYVVSLLLEDA